MAATTDARLAPVAPRARVDPARASWLALGALAGLGVLAWLIDEGALETLALTLPALALAMFVTGRFPVLVVVGAFFYICFANTIGAYAGVPNNGRSVLYGMLFGVSLVALRRYLSNLPRTRARFWPGVLLLAAYLLISFLLALRAENVEQALDGYQRQVLYLGAFLAFAYVQWARPTREAIVKGIVGVFFLASAYAMLRYAIGPGAREVATVTRYEIVGDTIALFGSFAGRQDFAGFVSVALPALIALSFGLSGRWRLLALAGAAGLAIGVFASQTRVASGATVAGLVVVAVLLAGSRASAGRRPLIATVVVLGIAATAASFVAIVADDPARADRYANIFNPSNDPSGANHYEKWKQAAREIRGEPFGKGLGTVGTAGDRFKRFSNVDNVVIDSSYVSIAYQQGWWMMGLMVASLLALAYGLARGALGLTDRLDATMAAAGAGAIAALLVLFSTGAFNERFCTPIAMALAGLGAAPLLSGARRRRQHG